MNACLSRIILDSRNDCEMLAEEIHAIVTAKR